MNELRKVRFLIAVPLVRDRSIGLLAGVIVPVVATRIARRGWVEANARIFGAKELHRDAQCAMFGAAKEVGLDASNRDAMIGGINQLLGVHATSRTELTPLEMRVVTLALEEGCFARNWRVVREIDVDFAGVC